MGLTIFAGSGADTIHSGTGADRIDLSEAVQSRDTVTLDMPSTSLGVDEIYGFSQGALGDVFNVSAFLTPSFELFPLVPLGSAPAADYSGGILMVTGSGLSTAMDLKKAFQKESG